MRELIDFTDDVVMVTAGASGIGRGMATEFAKEGADVVIADIDLESARSTAAEIRGAHDREVLVSETDVSSYEDCQATVASAREELGTVDVLVNCAAGGHTGDPDISGMTKPFLEETPVDWEPQFEVTLRGPLNATSAVLPGMVEQGSGSVISIVSDAHKGHDPGVTVYAAAKAGVATFTKSIAKEVGEHGIRVNAISPGTTRTPSSQDLVEQHGDAIVQSYPLDRLGLPEDHANMAVFLASDAADWVTGQVVSVNGGFS